jgi:hypothetical protein
VVSQWTCFLKVIAKHLHDVVNAKYALFTGNVAIKDRQVHFYLENIIINLLLFSILMNA